MSTAINHGSILARLVRAFFCPICNDTPGDVMPQDDEWSGEDRRAATQKWHVGKEVPIAVLLVLVVQTAGGVWWLAQFSSKLDYAIETLRTFQVERYTREDARRDKELLMQVIDGLRQKDNEYERRVTALENRPGRGLQ